jgi:hypothetical protein
MTLGPRPHAAHRGVMTWPTAVAGTFGPAHSRVADGTFPMLPRSALANPLRIPVRTVATRVRRRRKCSHSATGMRWTVPYERNTARKPQRRGRHRSLFATYVQIFTISASNL